MIYEERFVAFIDILGFKNIIEETENDQAKQVKLLKIMKHIEGDQKANYDKESFYFGNPITREITCFSDSIIISYSVKADMGGALFHILIDLGFRIRFLLANGMLVRGGVSSGALYHKENICFGPALVNAYKMEKDAKYPRIIVDEESIIRDIENPGEQNNSDQERQALRSILRKDEQDDKWYFNFLAIWEDFDDRYEYYSFLGMVKNLLETALKKNYEVDISEKYTWFTAYYNNVVKGEIPSNLHQKFLIKI